MANKTEDSIAGLAVLPLVLTLVLGILGMCFIHFCVAPDTPTKEIKTEFVK